MAAPTDDDLLPLWTELVANPLTAARFADAVWPVLLARLAAALPHADPHDVATAAEDTLLAVLKRPDQFDPSRGRLTSFLVFAAKRDYLNRIAGERRHTRGRIPWDSVELAAADRKEEEDDSPSFDDPRLRPVLASFPEPDRRVFDLMRAGERRTAAFAAVLGAGHLSVPEQEAAVKRAKDRIKAALKRAVGGSDA